MTQWKKEQLFALVSFYYSFDGESWPQNIKDDWLIFEKDECYWFSTGFGLFDEEGKYNENDLLVETSLADGTGLWFALSNSSPCNDAWHYQILQLAQLQLSTKTPILPPEISLLTNLLGLALPINGRDCCKHPRMAPKAVVSNGSIRALTFEH